MLIWCVQLDSLSPNTPPVVQSTLMNYRHMQYSCNTQCTMNNIFTFWSPQTNTSNTLSLAPSIAAFTATRTNLNTFNFSVTFDYLGAASINFNITICYKPQGSSVAATCMAGILWQPDTSLLVWTATATISDPAIQSVKAEFSLLAFNTAELSCQHPPVNELLCKWITLMLLIAQT